MKKLIILLLFATPCFASPKSTTVQKPCDEMYKMALVKAGHDGYAVFFIPESDGKACRIETDRGSSNSERFRKQLAEMALLK